MQIHPSIINGGVVLTGPSADGSANQILETDGSGTLSFVTPSAGSSAYPTGHIDGLITSNGTDADHDIDITTGTCRDSTDAEDIVLASAITKQIDASWAVGTNQGGLDGTESSAGTPDANTWYAMWVIKRSDTGVEDVLFSESFSSPTMPSVEYDFKRYIGAVLTDSSANIYAYTQLLDTFWWVVRKIDLNDTTPVATITAIATTNPPIQVEWLGNAYVEASSAASKTLAIQAGHETVAYNNLAAYLISHNADEHMSATNPAGVWTNTSGEIKYVAGSTSGHNVFQVVTAGWKDPRGRAIE